LESLKGRDHFRYQIVDGRIILKLELKEIGFEDINGVCVPQDRDHWWAFLNTVINLLVP
jgi:hypothetical protein